MFAEEGSMLTDTFKFFRPLLFVILEQFVKEDADDRENHFWHNNNHARAVEHLLVGISC